MASFSSQSRDSEDESRYNDSSRRSTTTRDDEPRFSVFSSIFGLPQWFRENALEMIFLPFTYMILRLSLFTLISSTIYLTLYIYFMPTALISEPAYFDYGHTPPIAKINLLAKQRQWSYITRGDTLEQRSAVDKIREKFLRRDFAYSIDTSFLLAKSPRNLEVGKFMIYCSVIDNTGEVIAKSARPVSMPFQSTTTLLLQSLISIPWRVVGLQGSEDVVTVQVPLMNDYHEPSISDIHSEIIELQLSTPDFDISETHITVMPVLTGFVYYMWYYPLLSALLGITSLTTLQMAIYLTYTILSTIIKYIVSIGEEMDNDGTMTDTSSQTDGNGDDGSDSDSNDQSSSNGDHTSNNKHTSAYLSSQSHGTSNRSQMASTPQSGGTGGTKGSLVVASRSTQSTTSTVNSEEGKEMSLSLSDRLQQREMMVYLESVHTNNTDVSHGYGNNSDGNGSDASSLVRHLVGSADTNDNNDNNNDESDVSDSDSDSDSDDIDDLSISRSTSSATPGAEGTTSPPRGPGGEGGGIFRFFSTTPPPTVVDANKKDN